MTTQSDEERKAKRKAYMREYRRKNAEKIAAQKRRWNAANKDKTSEMNRRYREKNRDKIKAHLETTAERRSEVKRLWSDKNKDRLRKYRRDYWHRKKFDPQTRLASNLRTRLNQAIRKGQKSGSAVRDLGCSIESFIQFIEKKFQRGMSWDNYGEWQLDHIKPLAHFDLTDREQFLEAAHFSNYQPMWARDNNRKRAS